ncbi:MAG: cytochrome c biogenesis CcdA family protein [bacterium]|nr:cytochrome c biogenesis CcdA family protein [bacterium]
MELLLGASIIATFIAGAAALFAPCCITVLLPSYFASIFREKYKVFLMTFIFFLGILTVFLPIGLGAGILSQIFKQYHDIVYGLAGIFMLVLGTILLLGIHFSMPFRVNTTFKKHNAISVYTLGIFSGIATTCCAPVLAGVLTLSVLPGSFIWGGVLSLIYVLGMVAPLFILSVLIDKSYFTQKITKTFQKGISYSLGKKRVRITISEAISGGIFLFMGILIIVLDLLGKLFMPEEQQRQMNIFLINLTGKVNDFVKFIPGYVWIIIFILVLALIVKASIGYFKKENHGERN